jgi:hypothetical protein
MGLFEKFRRGGEEEKIDAVETSETSIEDGSEESEVEELREQVEEFAEEVAATEITPEEKKFSGYLKEEEGVIGKILDKDPSDRSWHKSFRGSLAALSLLNILGGGASQAFAFEDPEKKDDAPRPAAVLIENEYRQLTDQEVIALAQQRAAAENSKLEGPGRGGRLSREQREIKKQIEDSQEVGRNYRGRGNRGSGKIQTPDDVAYGVFDRAWGEVEEFGKNAKKAKKRIERQQKDWKKIFGGGGRRGR